MFRRNFMVLLAIAAPALVSAACDSVGSSVGVTPNKVNARLTVQLTDAPADLAEAWVKVKKVQLVADSVAPDTTAAADTSKTTQLAPDSGWVNLLALAGGKTTNLFSGAVRAGRYSQVRVIVCDMYIKTTDGQIVATPGTALPSGVTATAGTELKLTSQCQSGFKVQLRGDSLHLGADSASALVIDFDAKRSFVHEAGKSGKWIVTPVLFGSVGKGSTTGAGSIKGTVTLAQGITLPVTCGALSLTKDSLLKAFVPTAAKGDTIHTGTTTVAGAFTIPNLAPATYTLGAEKLGFANGDTLSYTAAATPATVPVSADSAAKADYAVSAVACKAHS